MPRRFKSTGSRGFTLIELITVMFIVSVLGSIVLPNMRVAFYRAKLSGCEGHLRNIAAAQESYTVDHTKYPAQLSELAPNYIKYIPTCPASLTDTYSPGYEVSPERDAYTVHCSGTNHDIVKLPANRPYYNSTHGLVEK